MFLYFSLDNKSHKRESEIKSNFSIKIDLALNSGLFTYLNYNCGFAKPQVTQNGSSILIHLTLIEV